jgi:peptide/nickel transport system ATP-binding protein
LHGVGFTVEAGRSFGVVGESGCGKSTLARAVMALERPTQGRVRLKGVSLFDLPPAQLQTLRRHFQMLFQDPYGSLDPRHKVARIVAEPLAALAEREARAERRERVEEALGEVGLKPNDGDKYPHEFSGGQRQRIAIARALITRPDLIVADEPVSALDVSVQAQVLNLMMDLQERHDLTYLFIGHDLSVVRHVTDRVAVMYLGRRPSLHPGPARRRAQARSGAPQGAKSGGFGRGAAAGSGGTGGRLSLRAPLPSCGSPLPSGRTGVKTSRHGPSGRLPLRLKPPPPETGTAPWPRS